MKNNKIIRKIKELFGRYEPGFEYLVDLNDIEIQIDFLKLHPKRKKMIKKWEYYNKTGEFESPILLDRDFVLRNGYTSYLIAKTENMRKVPVYFVD